MDLYKHAYRLSPMVPSELVADCFELARDIRVLDMRASPYDLSDLGYSPVRVETAAGKQEYADGPAGVRRAGRAAASPAGGRVRAAARRGYDLTSNRASAPTHRTSTSVSASSDSRRTSTSSGPRSRTSTE